MAHCGVLFSAKNRISGQTLIVPFNLQEWESPSSFESIIRAKLKTDNIYRSLPKRRLAVLLVRYLASKYEILNKVPKDDTLGLRRNI